MPQVWVKPDGSITNDAQDYGKAWKEINSFVETAFPGFQCWGFDPDVCMTDGRTYFSLPRSAVVALKKGMANATTEPHGAGALPADAGALMG